MGWNQVSDFIVLDPDPDPHWPNFVDPDPHSINGGPHHCPWKFSKQQNEHTVCPRSS